MRIVSIEQVKNKAKRYRIRLDNGADFVLYRGEMLQMGLAEDEEITTQQYEALLTDILIPRAKARTMHLLEKQDRTESNIRQKLREGGYPMEAIDEAVAYAASYHYVDDRRYAENYIYFHKDSKSCQRLKQDLLRKGIAKEVVEAALEEGYETDERGLIAELLAKKHYNPEEADQKERAKMYRFLASRGFSPGDIMDALRD